MQKRSLFPNAIVFCSLPILILGVVAFFDVAIVEWIAASRTDWVTATFEQITDIGEGTEYFGMALFLLFLGLANQGKAHCPLHLNSVFLRDYGWLCLKVLIVTGLTLLLLKIGFGRSRPDLWIEHHILEFVPLNFESTHDYKSFPSGHSQTAFTAAVLISLLLPRKLHVFVYSIAALVGLSRVVLLAHWPTDVIAGAIVGVVLPVLIIRNSGITRYSAPTEKYARRYQ